MTQDQKRLPSTVTFDRGDLEAFREFSGDRNPLHWDDEFARATPYGEPVVFGMLGVLASFARLGPRLGQVLSEVVVDFESAMYAGVSYAVDCEHLSDTAVVLRLRDGSDTVVKTRVAFEPGTPARGEPRTCEPVRTTAATWTGADLSRVVEFRGAYGPNRDRAEQIFKRLGLTGRSDMGSWHFAVIALCSYLVGMEIPGRNGLFTKATIRFENGAVEGDLLLEYEARVKRYDPRFSLVWTSCSVAAGAGMRAAVSMQSFLREDVVTGGIDSIDRQISPSNRLGGRVALVIGGSRGLGASFVRVLARQGCTVVCNYHRSHRHAQKLKEELVGSDVELSPGDAGKSEWCGSARQLIERDYGRLDFLVCNACPAIHNLPLGVSTWARIEDYVYRSLSLVGGPLAYLLELLDRSKGWSIVVSTAAVREPLPGWAHYVAAKQAIEGLVGGASCEYQNARFLVVRPGKLLTDMMNTPNGRIGAQPPETIAVAVVKRLIEYTGLERSILMDSVG